MADDKRRRHLVKLAEAHGDRVQKSLFALALHREEGHVLGRALGALATESDKIALRRVCASCRANERWQGKGSHPERLEPFWIV